MYEEKIDNEGTNCKGVEELVDEYYTDLENYSTNWMLLMMIILIISTSTPCIIYREKIKVFIKEQMRDKFINLLGNVYGMERVYHEEGELDELEYQAREVNSILKGVFRDIGLTLVDFKLEFGYDCNDNIILADELSPDGMRLWKGNKSFDKDLFRKGEGDIVEAYQYILNNLQQFA